MRVLKNILITIGLFILAIVVAGIIIFAAAPISPADRRAVSKCLVGLLVLGTALWASISSSNLEFRQYKTGMSYHPVTIFILHLLLWIVAFPWFLTVRDNIKDGTAELKDEFKQRAYPPSYPQHSYTPTPPPISAVAPRPAGGPNSPPPLPASRTHLEIERGDLGSSGFPPPLPAPPPIPGRTFQSPPDHLDQLQKLADLKAKGILTEEEFQAEKRKVLG